jgi:hypothetical protein
VKAVPLPRIKKGAADVFPGGGIDKARYGSDAAYTAGIPTGMVNTSVGSRNLQFALKLHF